METDKKTGEKNFSGQSIKVMLLPFKQENTDRYRVAGQLLRKVQRAAYP
jgi:hypothetical protein